MENRLKILYLVRVYVLVCLSDLGFRPDHSSSRDLGSVRHVGFHDSGLSVRDSS